MDDGSESEAARSVVWLVQHVVEYDDAEDIEMIGVYATEAAARAAVAQVISQPGFRDTPDGFHVDAYTLNRTWWQEGFVRVFREA